MGNSSSGRAGKENPTSDSTTKTHTSSKYPQTFTNDSKNHDCVSPQNKEMNLKENVEVAARNSPKKNNLNYETQAQLLLKACLSGDIRVVKDLVSRGHSVNSMEVLDPLTYETTDSTTMSVPKRNYISPLIAAITGGHMDVIRHLFSCGCHIDSTFKQISESDDRVVSGVTPLMLACQNKRHELIVFLLAAMADFKARDSDNNTMLHYVCRPQQQNNELGVDRITNTLLLLKTFKFDVINPELIVQRNARGNTALHSLAFFNNISAMTVLLEVLFGPQKRRSGSVELESADENYYRRHPPPPPNPGTLLINEVGMTPLHIATLQNSLRMVQLLLDYCFDPTVKESSGMDVYQLAKVTRIQLLQDSERKSLSNHRSLVEDELRAYRAARERQEGSSASLADYDDDDIDGFDMNDSSITFEENVLYDEDDVTETPSSASSTKQLGQKNKKCLSRPGSLPEKSTSSLEASPSRKANPFPKGQQLSKQQQMIRAAMSLLSGEFSLSQGGGKNKKKKKKSKRKKSPLKPRATPSPMRGARQLDQTSTMKMSSLLLNGRHDSPPRTRGGTTTATRGGTTTTTGRSSTTSSTSSTVTPSKHSRTAHSSMVHRGKAAASSSSTATTTMNLLASNRHDRAKSAWPVSSPPAHGPASYKVSPAPSTLRGHRGGKDAAKQRGAKKGTNGQEATAQLPLHFHSSPSGVLTITFS